jgi:hypothetical protein
MLKKNREIEQCEMDGTIALEVIFQVIPPPSIHDSRLSEAWGVVNSIVRQHEKQIDVCSDSICSYCVFTGCSMRLCKGSRFKGRKLFLIL